MVETVVSNAGKRFEEERLKLRKSQEELAADGDVSRKTINRIENGKTPPSTKLLERLASLGFDTQYVLTGVPSKNLKQVAEEAGVYKTEKGVGALSREEETLVELFRQLRPPDRTHAKAVVSALASKSDLKGKAKKGDAS